MKTKYKWDEPTPTLSGRDVISIWNDLKKARTEYKLAFLYDDEDKMVLSAIEIQNHQKDLGLNIETFPILTKKDELVK